MTLRRIAWALLALALVVAACDGSAGDQVSTTQGAPASSTTTTTDGGSSGTSPPPASPQQPTESLPGVDRILSGEVGFPDGVEIPAGEVWAFDPTFTTTVEAGGNVVVRGSLVMRPADRTVEHTLRFVGVDEQAFEGGGMEPLAGDVGLWVVDEGTLDLEGTERTAWDYEWHDEWAGDEVVAAPNTAGDYETFTTAAGPDDVPPPNELALATELLDLTRNVRIEGTPQGKTHVLIHSSQPQTIRYVAIRYVGPAFGEEVRGNRAEGGDQSNVGSDVTGRYGLHFHRCGDGSRGSIVEGVVIRDADNHAFVPHDSHGITFRDTIAYGTTNEAYWWDPASRQSPSNASNDIRYEHVVAAAVTTTRGTGSAFALSNGEGNALVDSVAVGVVGRGHSLSGYHWPGTEKSVWTFEGNTAHNNIGHGIRVWQNVSATHVIERFTGYYNGMAGILHGAYSNSYVYRDLTLFDNGLREGGDIAVQANAVGRPASDGGTDRQEWDHVVTNGATIVLGRHAVTPDAPVRFVDCDFSSVVVEEGPNNYSTWEFVDCSLQPEDIEVRNLNARSVLRVQNGTEAWQLTTDGVTEIDPFV